MAIEDRVLKLSSAIALLAGTALIPSPSLAGTAVELTVVDGTLHVTGGEEADSITVACEDGKVVINGKILPDDCDSIRNIAVDARGGADAVDLTAVSDGAGYVSLQALEIGGGEGNDRLAGSAFPGDHLDGEAGHDTVEAAGSGAFVLTPSTLSVGSLGTDDLARIEEARLVGRMGNNAFRTVEFAGPVTLLGGRGNDIFESGMEIDHVFGGAGIDRVMAEADRDMTLSPTRLAVGGSADFLAGIETAVLSGGASSNVIDASAFAGNVNLNGGAGVDTLRGGAGADDLFGDGAGDLLVGGAGRDIVDAGGGNDSVRGQRGGDVLVGRSGDDTLRGGPGNDVLVGGPGNDLLFGGPGDDDLYHSRDTVAMGMRPAGLGLPRRPFDRSGR